MARTPAPGVRRAQIDQRITLASMVAAAGLSRMQFPVHFRAGTGMRPHDYVLQQRIERAKVVIATERMRLAEVALSVGFQTQSHFSTVFKRLTGETSGQWRRADHQPVRAPPRLLRSDGPRRLHPHQFPMASGSPPGRS
jgi:AraC family transcriptional regulator